MDNVLHNRIMDKVAPKTLQRVSEVTKQFLHYRRCLVCWPWSSGQLVHSVAIFNQCPIINHSFHFSVPSPLSSDLFPFNIPSSHISRSSSPNSFTPPLYSSPSLSRVQEQSPLLPCKQMITQNGLSGLFMSLSITHSGVTQTMFKSTSPVSHWDGPIQHGFRYLSSISVNTPNPV